MPKIETLELFMSDPLKQQKFYHEILGMHELEHGRVGYSEEEMGVRFLQAQSPYQFGKTDLYWKFTIAVPDLDLACQQLAQKGINVPAPQQFRDVGYLTKITDPEGFVIELIQHVFEGETSPKAIDTSRLGGGPSINLLTLRCHDANMVDDFCITELGMRPLSVQPLEPFGFTLYFYAFTNQQPPGADLKAVANRSWTYQRPYTVLEVQHLHDASYVNLPTKGAAGYGRAIITGTSFTENNPLGLAYISDLNRHA